MPELTELDNAYLQRDAAWFWVDAMLLCQKTGTAFNEAHVAERIDHLRNMDPADVKGLPFTPAEWDEQNLVRLPFIEAAGQEIVEKLSAHK